MRRRSIICSEEFELFATFYSLKLSILFIICPNVLPLFEESYLYIGKRIIPLKVLLITLIFQRVWLLSSSCCGSTSLLI